MKKNIIQDNKTTVNLVTGLLTMIVQLVVNFFLSPYIVKTLGEEANGFTQLANNFVQYATLITLAFNSMAGRFMSVEYHRQNFKKVKEYYSSVVVCDIFVIALFIPVCIFIIFKIDALISIGNSNLNDVQMLFSCVFINFFINLILSLFNMSMFVMNMIYIQNLINFIKNILNAVLLLCIFSIFPARMYFVSLIMLILSVISLPIYTIIQKRIMPSIVFKRNNFSIKALKNLLKSGMWNTINQCGNMLMTGFDLLLSNLFVDASSMGVLAVSKIIPNAIVSLANVLNTSFSPELTINWANGNNKLLINDLKRSMKISCIIISIPIVTFTCFSRSFYYLWQPELDAKQLSFLSFLTMMALIPLAGTQVLYNVFTTTNRLKENSIIFLVGGILNIIIVYILLKTTSLGIYAIAGVSACITLLRNLIFVLPYSAKLLGEKWSTFYKEVFLSLLISLINALIAFVVLSIIHVNNWVTLIIGVVITCVAALFFEILIMLDHDEREMVINKIIRRKSNG